MFALIQVGVVELCGRVAKLFLSAEFTVKQSITLIGVEHHLHLQILLSLPICLGQIGLPGFHSVRPSVPHELIARPPHTANDHQI